MKKETEVYLGDGLYASFDNDCFEIRTPRMGASGDIVDHYIVLGPYEMTEFINFISSKVGPEVVEKMIKHDWT